MERAGKVNYFVTLQYALVHTPIPQKIKKNIQILIVQRNNNDDSCAMNAQIIAS